MKIRSATPDDALSIITHIDDVYGWNAHLNKDRFQNWEKKVSKEFRYYRMLEDKHAVIGICYAGWRFLNYGNRTLKMSDLGEICIANDLQGQGFGSALINDYHEGVCNNHIDLCRLHFRTLDLISFYEQSGYHIFHTMEVEICAKTEDQKRPPQVRLYDRDQDFQQCVELYNDYNKDYLGSLKWDPQQGNWNNKMRIVWDAGNGIEGYLYTDEAFGQVAFDREKPEIFHDMLVWILRQNGKIITKLPCNSYFKELMNNMDIDYSYKIIEGADSHNMMRVCNLGRLKTQFNFEGSFKDLFPYKSSTGGSEIWGSDNLNLTKYPLE